MVEVTESIAATLPPFTRPTRRRVKGFIMRKPTIASSTAVISILAGRWHFMTEPTLLITEATISSSEEVAKFGGFSEKVLSLRIIITIDAFILVSSHIVLYVFIDNFRLLIITLNPNIVSITSFNN